MKIGELSKRSGISAHTLRYYEGIGLLPYADRDASGIRDYDISILGWIEFLCRLKTTGMSLREMLRYAALRDAGTCTIADRQELLKRHRESVSRKIAELQSCLLVLDNKINGYSAQMQGTDENDAI